MKPIYRYTTILLLFVFSTFSNAQEPADPEIEIIGIEQTEFPATIGEDAWLKTRYVLLYDLKKAKKSTKVYGADALDQMPLFDASCSTDKNPQDCSENAIKEYLKENVEYPEKALKKGQEGLEKLYFVLDEQGKVEGDIKVISKESPCADCAKAAVKAVKKMPAWRPGMVDGKPVKTKVILPVRFDKYDINDINP